MFPGKDKAPFEIFRLPALPAAAALCAAALLATPPVARAGEETTPSVTTASAGQEPGGENKKSKTELLITGTLPPRKTSAGASLALGHAAPGGFLVGADIFVGWRIARVASINFCAGGGSVEKRSGRRLSMFHGEVTFPVRIAICSHLPRVCPGLDLYFAVIPGAGYGVMIQNKPVAAVNHAINLIAGVAFESIRTYGNMDAGVRLAGYLYFDVLKDNDESDPWLAYEIIELGVIIRWGKT